MEKHPVNRRDFIKYPYRRLKLTAGSAEKEKVPFSSGLNWGQRPGREPNQAYLAVPVSVQKDMFFPEVGVPFILISDDGWLFECKRAQQNGKAIHTQNNSELGRYFRHRVGLAEGALITLRNLIEYGRTTIDVYKVAPTTFVFDFSAESFANDP